MGRNMYIGVNDTAKRVKKIYIGVGDKAKKVLKGYIGVGGKAKLFFSSECEIHTWDYPTDEYGNSNDHGTCSVCGFECSKPELTSSFTPYDVTDHWHNTACDICDFGRGDLEKHEWNNGICDRCKYVCKHEWNNGVCNICDYECTNHDWKNKDGKCATCGLTCKHEWNNGVCNICDYECTEHDWTNKDGVCAICELTCNHKYANGTSAEEESDIVQPCENCAADVTTGTRTSCKICHKVLSEDVSFEGQVLCDSCSTGGGGGEEPSEPSEPEPTHEHTEYEDPAPTCTSPGVKVYYCPISDCEHNYTETLEALGHDYSNGSSCTRCGEPCTHDFSMGSCQTCGASCGNEFDPETGLCIRCGDHTG